MAGICFGEAFASGCCCGTTKTEDTSWCCPVMTSSPMSYAELRDDLLWCSSILTSLPLSTCGRPSASAAASAADKRPPPPPPPTPPVPDPMLAHFSDIRLLVLAGCISSPLLLWVAEVAAVPPVPLNLCPRLPSAPLTLLLPPTPSEESHSRKVPRNPLLPLPEGGGPPPPPLPPLAERALPRSSPSRCEKLSLASERTQVRGPL